MKPEEQVEILRTALEEIVERAWDDYRSWDVAEEALRKADLFKRTSPPAQD